MSGTFREWVEGSKVTEKHLSGMMRGLPDTVVEGLVVSDAGGLTIDISAGKALITGYEQRYSAISGQSLIANYIVHIYATGRETFSYVFSIPAAEGYPPGGVPSEPGYLLIAIVQCGAAAINWIWNNPFVRGGHVDENCFRVGRGLPDKSLLHGMPHVLAGSQSIGATSWGTLLSWPSPGTARGRLSWLGWTRINSADELSVRFDGETPRTFYVSEDLWSGGFPTGGSLLYGLNKPGSGQIARFSKSIVSPPASWTQEVYWHRGQFEQSFLLEAYNSGGGSSLYYWIAAWEEFPSTAIGGY